MAKENIVVPAQVEAPQAESTPVADEAVTLNSFAEKFGRGGSHSRYIKGRAAKVNKIEEVEPFLDEFASNAHKRGEMRRQLMQLGGIEEEVKDANKN